MVTTLKSETSVDADQVIVIFPNLPLLTGQEVHDVILIVQAVALNTISSFIFGIKYGSSEQVIKSVFKETFKGQVNAKVCPRSFIDERIIKKPFLFQILQ